jgi:hypothetical protein
MTRFVPSQPKARRRWAVRSRADAENWAGAETGAGNWELENWELEQKRSKPGDRAETQRSNHAANKRDEAKGVRKRRARASKAAASRRNEGWQQASHEKRSEQADAWTQS